MQLSKCFSYYFFPHKACFVSMSVFMFCLNTIQKPRVSITCDAMSSVIIHSDMLCIHCAVFFLGSELPPHLNILYMTDD